MYRASEHLFHDDLEGGVSFSTIESGQESGKQPFKEDVASVNLHLSFAVSMVFAVFCRFLGLLKPRNLDPPFL